jgi:aryl-alcohol dehydrogenase-like predicted oxidoreductase
MQMKKKSLGSTGLRVSEIGFGAWAIGGDSYGQTDDNISTLAIEEALNQGCNLFDTADVYGSGHSEILLGRSLRRAGVLDDIVIATKGGLYSSIDSEPFDFSVGGIVRSAEASLRRLGRGFIDIYQIHNPPLDVLTAGAVFEALLNLKDRGLVRYCGVSVQTLAEGRAAINWDQLSYCPLGQFLPPTIML